MKRMMGVLFRQLFDSVSCTYTYLLADTNCRSAILIDPVLEHVKRDVKLVEELNLNLLYAVVGVGILVSVPDSVTMDDVYRGSTPTMNLPYANTHVHADHITGTGEIKNMLPNCKSVISKASGAKADKYLDPMDILKIGEIELEVRPTPGHTNGCVTYVYHQGKMAFTGDALLYRGCGRTDFQQGDSARLYDSVHTQILSLPEEYLLYPAHDYKGNTVTSVWEEKKYNARLTKTKEEFIDIMKNLNLAYPKMIDKAVPANLVCGYLDDVKH